MTSAIWSYFFFLSNRSKPATPKNHRERLPCTDEFLQHIQVTEAPSTVFHGVEEGGIGSHLSAIEVN